ncbi:MAG: type I polyketide synthase [Gemmatales bacterium]|nr:MAG: type I polyketide synthase [Gemmatales bacterium]
MVGEGSALFVLKRLEDALANGDRIAAVITGIGLSNDVHGRLLAPSSEGQLRAMKAAYRQAGWKPTDIDLIECHATGTPVGDAIEFESLRSLWRDVDSSEGQCVIGSVKSNIGHALTAAGSAGVLKVILAMKEGLLPPTANYLVPNPALDVVRSPFRILKESELWQRRDSGVPRRAAVSAFGFGGINAHVLLEEWREPTSVSASVDVPCPLPTDAEPVAIVGMGIYTARACNVTDFARQMFRVDDIPRLPERWWGVAQSEWFRQRTLPAPAGFYLNEVEFPADRFRIPPKELEESLPQQLLMLIAAEAAIADCQWKSDRLLQTGVFIGLGLDLNTTNFSFRWSLLNEARRWSEQLGLELSDEAFADWVRQLRDAAGPPLTANRTMGALGGIVASRVAREWRIGGPSFTVSSEEMSGLHALLTAAKLLQRGDIDQALVGAVDLPGDVRAVLTATEPFTPCDGAVAVVLKRKGDAIRDGDRIYALVELDHSTGQTTAGPDSRPKFEPGEHLGAADALAQALKSVLCLYFQVRPGPFGPQYWLRNRCEGPRTCDLPTGDSLGKAIIRLKEAEHTDHLYRRPPIVEQDPALIAIEGNSTDELRDVLLELEDRAKAGSVSVSQLARRWLADHPLDARRKYGLGLLAADLGELNRLVKDVRESLGGEWNARRFSERAFFSPHPIGNNGKLAFVFPGSGNHYPGMGRRLALRWPEVLQRQDAENQRLRDQMLPDIFWEQASLEGVTSHQALIFGQVTFGAMASDVLHQLGLRPSAAIGYSLGESTALFALRAWTERDEMLRRMESSPLFQSELAGECLAARRCWKLPPDETVDWVAGVVVCSADEVRQAIADSERVYLLIVNTPAECVIGGRRVNVDKVVQRLGCKWVPLMGVSTVHCEIARQVEKAYRDLHLLPTSAPAGVRFYSGAWQRSYELNRESAADAILAGAVNTLNFPGLIEQAYADGVRIFIEVGPGNSCTRMIRRILQGQTHFARSVCVAGADEVQSVYKLLGQLIAERVPIDLARLYDNVRDSAAPAARRVLRVPVGGGPFQPPPIPRPTPKRQEPARSPTRASSQPDTGTPIVATAAGTADVMDRLASLAEANAHAHESFLRFSNRLATVMAGQIGSSHRPGTEQSFPDAGRHQQRPAFDYADCLEFARGSIGSVLGDAFREVDSFPTRVRLPDEPLMLVHRILQVEGEPKSLSSGRVVTEHDILADVWYLDCGRIPTCIAVEAGQADLFLSGYLGIDFHTRGLAVYRLLDAVVTFHRSLPGPGSTIRYDIHIDRFFRQGRTWLFRFRFDATIAGEPLLTMTDGCAGFFTQAELQAGKGIVHTALDMRSEPRSLPDDWIEFVPVAEIESYDERQIDALRQGDLASCFGSPFDRLPLENPARLPGGRMTLVHRITRLERRGGRFGLGFVRGEADIHPDDWFLTCHFVDDRVMPGTLMYECCLHTLRVFLMRLGWVGEDGEFACEPVPGVASRLKCRGQVIETTRCAAYEITIKEIGYRPEPYVLVDALMYADGKAIVEITDMSLRLTGLSKERLRQIWDSAKNVATGSAGERRKKPAIFDSDRILAFAIGKPSEAFGEPYRIFDNDRVIARLPGPPYQFLDRITEIVAEPWKMQAGGVIEAEYDVPSDAWYFAANRQPWMPFSVLLEVALQPCGWLAAYIGSALTSEVDLHFRNLGGTATQFAAVPPTIGTLTTKVRITNVSASAGMIIQHYEFDMHAQGRRVYQGKTYFGFFSDQALAQQVGIRDARLFVPAEAERNEARRFTIPDTPPYPDRRYAMVDQIDLLCVTGGPHGLGLIQGSKRVDPEAWFFQAHFYQDPVWPGSLGLESFLQLLKVFAVERWHCGPNTAFDTIHNESHEWLYRGQVVPADHQVSVQAAITNIDDGQRRLKAEGFLVVDGRVIYQMKNFGIRITGDQCR